MHSVGSQKIYINTPLEQSNQVSMQYLKGSKYRKWRDLALCSYNKWNCPEIDTSPPQQNNLQQVDFF